jgi:hypothetical protein
MQRHMIAVRHCAANLAKLRVWMSTFGGELKARNIVIRLIYPHYISSLNFIYFVTIDVPAILDYRISTVDGLWLELPPSSQRNEPQSLLESSKVPSQFLSQEIPAYGNYRMNMLARICKVQLYLTGDTYLEAQPISASRREPLPRYSVDSSRDRLLSSVVFRAPNANPASATLWESSSHE